MSTTDAYTDAIGHYINPSNAICASCWKTEPEWSGFDGWDEPAAIFADTESDSPIHCARCDSLIPHKLTPDGLAYVLEAIQEAIQARANHAGLITRGISSVHDAVAARVPGTIDLHKFAWIWAREWFSTMLTEHTGHLLSAPESEILAVTCIDCRTVWTVDH